MNRSSMSDTTSPGIHHITGISGPAQEVIDFYSGFLGLRFVKKTVNFDDPTTYHLYFGDEAGSPGTILTFFPWADAPAGREGPGMTSRTAFSIPSTALDFWIERFAATGADFDAPVSRFTEDVLAFRDPHGLGLELVAHPEADARDAWASGPVGAEVAVCGFHGVTLLVPALDGPARLLRDVFGYHEFGFDGDRLRFAAPSNAEEEGGTLIDLVQPANGLYGKPGAGTIHHIALRARTDEDQSILRERVLELGIQVTPVIDRQYFRSVYFRHPIHTGGVLFEIATDSPGFLVDEPLEALGAGLMLPPQYETRRAVIESALPPLHHPER